MDHRRALAHMVDVARGIAHAAALEARELHLRRTARQLAVHLDDATAALEPDGLVARASAALIGGPRRRLDLTVIAAQRERPSRSERGEHETAAEDHAPSMREGARRRRAEIRCGVASKDGRLDAACATAMAIALVLAPTTVQAGPWTPEPGHGYLKLWVKALYGFGYVDGAGRMHEYGDYGELFLSGYAEAGIADGIALALHAPFYEGFLLEDPRTGALGDHHTIGDPTLGLRLRLVRADRFVAALELGVRQPLAPSGERQTVYGTATGNPAIGALRIGSGAFDVPLALSAGYAWDDFYLAGAMGAVLRIATPGVRDLDQALTWSLEGGGTFAGGMSLRVRVRGEHALPTGDPLGRHESPSGVGSGTSIGGFAVEADWPVAREGASPTTWMGVTAEGGIPGLLARQTGGPVLSAYVAARW